MTALRVETPTIPTMGLTANTKANYRGHISRFTRWCMARDLQALPATPDTLASYIDDTARSAAAAMQAASAIGRLHRDAGIDPAPHEYPEVRRAISRVRTAQAPRRPRPTATHEALERILAEFESDDSPVAARDRAIIRLAFHGPLRRSEISAIDVADVHVTDERLILAVPSRRHANALTVYEEPALVAVEAWRSQVDGHGPLFRCVHRSGAVQPRRMGGRAIGDAVKRRVSSAGLDDRVLTADAIRLGGVAW
jgi:integrase